MWQLIINTGTLDELIHAIDPTAEQMIGIETLSAHPLRSRVDVRAST
jgi:low affinity Fe/Cu permease